jgi:hypothetical protein
MVSIRKPGILPFCDALHSFRKAPKRDCKKKGEIRSGVQEFGLTNALSFYNRSEIKRSTPLPPNHEYDVPSNVGFLSVVVSPKGDQ